MPPMWLCDLFLASMKVVDYVFHDIFKTVTSASSAMLLLKGWRILTITKVKVKGENSRP
eukprot:m.20094 g.20094  ORF g.20094 m.20094 type:complete len:59 (-) comp5216_c1_seq1:46-222(-)